MSKTRIIHITSVHPRNDIRIFQKECCSLIDDFEVVLIVADGKGDEEQNSIKIIDVVKVNSKSRIKRMLLLPNLIFKVALEQNGAIYHFHDPELLPIGLKLIKSGKKVIYDVHEDLPRSTLTKEYIPFLFRRPLAFFLECYENFCVKKFTSIVSATSHINKRFFKRNNRAIVINNYPFISEASTLNSTVVKEKAICYIGAISRLRGVRELQEAAFLSNVKLYLAGSFSENDFEIELRSLSSWNNVVFLGQVNRQTVNETMSKSFAGVVTFHPAPNHCYSQPNKLFEYMASSLPVICSDFPIWRDLVENLNCGICVDPLDISSLSKTISFLANNDDLAIEMGLNGYKAIQEKYNWEIEKLKLINLYKLI